MAKTHKYATSFGGRADTPGIVLMLLLEINFYLKKSINNACGLLKYQLLVLTFLTHFKSSFSTLLKCDAVRSHQWIICLHFFHYKGGFEFQLDLGGILRSFKNTVDFQMSSVENEVLLFLPPPWDSAPADCSNQVASFTCSQITLFVCLLAYSLITYLFTLVFRDWLSLYSLGYPELTL